MLIFKNVYFSYSPGGNANAFAAAEAAGAKNTGSSFSHSTTVTPDKAGSEEEATPTLQDICLTLAQGRRLVVLGANGSGKSTLALLANGLLLPRRGEVQADGLATDERRSISELRSRVGLVTQDPDNQLVCTSVFEELAFGPQNLGWSPERIYASVEAALRAVGFGDAMRKRDPNTLSGGEKQRLIVAAVLAMAPRYLVLDEPTAMLDQPLRREVLAAVSAAQSRGCGILHITHDLREAELADAVLVLDRGRVVRAGNPQEVLANKAALRRYGLICEPRTFVAAGGFSTESWGKEHTASRANLVLELSDIAYTYCAGSDYAHPVLADVNLRLTQGSCGLLVGASGVGKSTLLRIAAGLLKPSQGRALLRSDDPTPCAPLRSSKSSAWTAGSSSATFGRSLSGRFGTRRRQPVAADQQRQAASQNLEPAQVGLVFQQPESQLFAQTLAADILFGPTNLGLVISKSQGEEIVSRCLCAVGLAPEWFRARSPFNLSGGEARRAAIATTLALDAPFLLLDEPTAGLDARGKARIYELLARLLAQGTGILIATHDPEYFDGLASVRWELRVADTTSSLAAASIPIKPMPALPWQSDESAAVGDPQRAAQLVDGDSAAVSRQNTVFAQPPTVAPVSRKVH